MHKAPIAIILLSGVALGACSTTALPTPETQPATQPAVTPADLAAHAKAVVEALEDRRINGEPLTPVFIEVCCAWSGRLRDAEFAAATTDPDRKSAMAEHLQRMKELRSSISSLVGEGSRSPLVPELLNYIVAEADPAGGGALLDAARDVNKWLEDRRAKGDPLTPLFIDLLCQADDWLFEAELVTGKTEREGLQFAETHLERAKEIAARPVTFDAPKPPHPFLARYHLAVARKRVGELEAQLSTTGVAKPATQPAVSPGEIARAAKDDYETLTASDSLDIAFIDLLWRCSRRWAEAQRSAAGNPHDRQGALDAHRQRMTKLRERIYRDTEHVSRVQQSQADYYLADAELMVKPAMP